MAKLGDRADYGDKIRIDGRPIKLHYRPKNKQRVLIYNKPEGEICSRSDPEGRTTIFERLPKLRSGRWVAVGRLDINTSGLILLTTDGELANKLMHPSSEIEREYAVRTMGEADEAVLKALQEGVELDDGRARFDTIRDAGGQGFNHWYHVTLAEGRKREVRRLWESQGITVSRLIRVRFGQLALPRGLRPGEWKELERRDLERLYTSVGLALDEADESMPEVARRGGIRRQGAPKRSERPRSKQKSSPRRRP